MRWRRTDCRSTSSPPHEFPLKLFFALWPEDATRLKLAPHRLEIARISGGKPTLPITMHVTLVFLGEVAEAHMPALEAVGNQIMARSFDYVLDMAACFHTAGVAWLGANSPPSAIMSLQAALQEGVRGAGFRPDHRAFRPHITVARNVVQEFTPMPIEPVTWRVNKFSLVRSPVDTYDPDYKSLRTWMLK